LLNYAHALENKLFRFNFFNTESRFDPVTVYEGLVEEDLAILATFR